MKTAFEMMCLSLEHASSNIDDVMLLIEAAAKSGSLSLVININEAQCCRLKELQYNVIYGYNNNNESLISWSM